MKRLPSKATLLKKRVRKIQKRAKRVGLLYLLGTIGLFAIAACMPMLSGTMISATAGMPVLTFYQPIVDLVNTLLANSFSLAALQAVEVTNAIAALLFAIMLLTMAVSLLRAFGKLGWLFKRRASYSNGFNRNMYAMDDIAKCFSKSLYTLIVMTLFVYLLSGGAPAVQITANAYIALGVGLGIHFICGLIGGTVTIFTFVDRVEEETRDVGLFVFFLRNLFQVAVVAAIIYFLAPASMFLPTVQGILTPVLAGNIGAIDFGAAIPGLVELVGWIFVAVLLGHAVAPTEYNTEGMDGPGMGNFTVFSFLTTVALVGVIVLGMATGLNQPALFAAIVAFVGFLLNCIIKPGDHEDFSYDDVDMEAYFRGKDQRDNSAIIY